MVQQITQLPPAAQRLDAPANFPVIADAHVVSLTTLVNEANIMGPEVNALANQAELDAASAASNGTAAEANAGFSGSWSSLTGVLNRPATVSHNSSDWRLLVDLVDVTTSEPGVTSDWIEINNLSNVRKSKLNNKLLDVLSKNKLINIISGKFSWSRTSPATSISRYGKLRHSPNTSTTNLVLRSEEIDNASWTKGQSTVTADSAFSPSGSLEADKLVEDSSTSNHRITQSVTVTSGDIITISVFAKASERTFLIVTGITTLVGTFFDIKNGTVGSSFLGTPDISKIEPAENGFFRCSVTFTAVSGSEFMGFYLAESDGVNSYTGDSSSGAFIWGIQVESSRTPNGYIKTLGSTVAGTSDFGIVQAREESKGWLNEGPTTNLMLRSEEIDNASWTNTRSSITANDIASPDDSISADKLVEDATASSTHFITQSVSFTNGLPYTISIFVKADERDQLMIFLNTTAFPVSTFANFDLTLGVVISTGSGAESTSIESIANGWFRISLTSTTTSTAASLIEFRLSVAGSTTFSGDGSSGLHIFGGQVEQQEFITSYMPTITTTETRDADDVSVVVDGNFLSSVQGDHSQFISYELLGDTGGDQIIYSSRSTGGVVNKFTVVSTTSDGSVLYRDGSANESDSPSATIGDLHSSVSVTESGTLKSYVDGVLDDPASLTADDTIDLTETLHIGSDDALASHFYGHISSFSIFDFALNQDEVRFLS